METIAIVGVGLIGGSFARALRHHGFRGRILGISSDATLKQALDRGIIDAGLPLHRALPEAELVLLAHPISRILDKLPTLDPHLRPGALVTDVGSTKREIVVLGEKAITRGIFLGGHPMAGKEQRGVEHADPNLFRGRTWFLSSSADRYDFPQFVAFTRLLTDIGAVPVPIAPDKHDELVSFTSHLPQLLSTALAALLSESLPRNDARLAAGPGLLDMTRLAGSSFDIWEDILSTNSERISLALDAFQARLTRLRESLPPDGGSLSAAVAGEFEIASDFANALRKSNT